MAGHGAEFTKKLRAAIKAKIEELGVEVDEELPDYIMVMVANKKEKNRMKNDLLLFLGKNSGVFVDWLFGFFEKLQSVGAGPAEVGPKIKKTENEDKPSASKPKEKERKDDKKEKTKKEEKKRILPPEKEKTHKERHESEELKKIKNAEKSKRDPVKERHRESEKDKSSKFVRPQVRGPTKSKSPTPPDSKKSKNRHEKEKPAEKSKSNENVLKRKRSSPPRPDYTPDTGDESAGERERNELRKALQEKSKIKVNPVTTSYRVEGKDDSENTFSDDDGFNRGSTSPPMRKTLKSEVVFHSKSHDAQPKLHSEVVVKGKEMDKRAGQQSLFLRAMSAVNKDYEHGVPRRYGHNSDYEDESVLQVPQVSVRRTVTNRVTIEQKPSFDEIFGLEDRKVQEHASDPFSEELQERLKVLKKVEEERTPSPTVEELPKERLSIEGDSELYVGEEAAPKKERTKIVDRKRPKRADDPLRAFMKLAGVNPKKAKQLEENNREEVKERKIVEPPTKLVVESVKTRGIVVKNDGTTITKTTQHRDDSPKAPITPLWNGQSLQIKVADLSSSDDEAEIDALVKSTEAIRSNTAHHEIPPTSVLSKPITYAHAAYVPPGSRRVSQAYMQPAPQTFVQPAAVQSQPTNTNRFDSNKIVERCRFWPNCRLSDEQCVYVHPKKPCANFPNCWYGDKCLYIHPKCKYDANCTNPKCSFMHTGQQGITSTQTPTTQMANTEAKATVTIQNDGLGADIFLVPSPSANVTQPAVSSLPQFSTVPCKFKGRCKNANCTFKHPPRCRFGPNCLNATCSFWHSTVDTSKYKWTAPTTSSQVSSSSL